MNAIISVIRWIPFFGQVAPSTGPAMAAAALAATAAAAPPAPPTGIDTPLSRVEAGLGSHYIRVTVAEGGR